MAIRSLLERVVPCIETVGGTAGGGGVIAALERRARSSVGIARINSVPPVLFALCQDRPYIFHRSATRGYRQRGSDASNGITP